MKVVVLGRGLPDSHSSYGKFEYEHALSLASLGHDVGYYFADNRSIKYIKEVKRYNEKDGKVIIRGVVLPIGGLPYNLFAVLKTRLLISLFSQLSSSSAKPDVVYAHFPCITLTREFIEYLGKKGIPLVCLEHWTKVQNKSIDGHRKSLLEAAKKRSAAFCCVSQDLAKSVSELVGCNEREIVLIPNMVSSDSFYYDQSKDARSKQRCDARFVWAGRVEKNKSVDLIVKAISLLTFEAHLDIIGTGADIGRIKRLAHELNVEDNVTFLGWKSPDEVGEIYRTEDCFVSASADETFCVPFAEAWMCGLPCVGSSNNPLRKMFDSRNGVLFERGDAASLASSLEYVWQHIGQFDPEVISTWATELFSTDSVVKKVESTLVEATSGMKMR